MDYKDKYLKYKNKYLELKKINQSNNLILNQLGGTKTKQIIYQNNKLEIINTIDDDILNEHSTFLIGSITKIFTVFTILILHQQHLLDINDTIIKYLDSKNINNNIYFNKIKIIDIINHISGIKQMPNKKKIHINTHYTNITDCIHTFINENLFINNKYGIYNYSNMGYVILGYIIEQITNKSYIESFQKYIFIPLKMNNTNIGESNIKLYSKNCKKLKKYEKNLKYWTFTAGSLYSCVNDLIIFAKESHKLLNNNTINILINNIYLGMRNNKNGHIGHSGNINGSSTKFNYKLNKNLLVENIQIEFNTCTSTKFNYTKYI